MTASVQSYRISGNTVLTQEDITRIMQKATGTNVTALEIRRALGQLIQAYRDRGLAYASVRLPRQVLTDGIVAVEVNEGTAPTVESAANQIGSNAPPSDKAKPSERTFEVRRYEVLGNTLLSQEAIGRAFTNATGGAVSLSQIQKALGDLQLAYRERGYATVAVALPQQQLTNATVKVQVTEGVLADIRVTGNRFFSSNNVRRALPSLHTNTFLNDRIFQRELDLANANRDRQIYPTVEPGPEPGTSALALRVKDRFPLHARLDLDNDSTPGTPEWRINSSAQYNNLWEREHQLGISYGFSPEAFKTDGLVPDYLFNRPLVSYYGAYYRLPFGSAESVSEQISRSTSFGYDEATHQFRLPPAGARPDFTLFASASSSDTGVKLGPASTVSQTPLLTIVSQDSGENLSVNESVGGRLNLPFPLSDTRRLNLSVGPDLKRYYLESFNTNNFIITTVVTNAQGSQTIQSTVASPQPSRKNEVIYLPLSLEAGYSQSDAGGNLSANLGVSGNFVVSSLEFAALAYSPLAKSGWAKAYGSITRDQRVFKEWSLLLRASGQAATGPLISTEQFPVGGLNSVRGYDEGDEYGDSGWFGSIELRTPNVLAHIPTIADFAPVWLRGSAFVDGGQRFLLDAPAAVRSTTSLCGTGVGISANLDNHLDLRIAVGWPLLDSANTHAGEPHAYFSLGGQF